MRRQVKIRTTIKFECKIEYTLHRRAHRRARTHNSDLDYCLEEGYAFLLIRHNWGKLSQNSHKLSQTSCQWSLINRGSHAYRQDSMGLDADI